MEPARFGQLLLDFNLITEGQLDECIELQAQQPVHKPLGEILLEQELLDEKTLGSILSVQRRKVSVARAQQQMTASELKQRLQTASMEDYLAIARQLGASDLMLSSEATPLIRIHGSLIELPAKPLDLNTCKEFLFSLVPQDQVAAYYERRGIHLTVTVGAAGRFRASVFRHLGGIAGIFRVLADRPVPFQKLGLPPVTSTFTDYSHGLVLVTGPSGCGKSTTLAAMLDSINRDQRRHIVTIEQPVEVIHQPEQSMISQVEVGRNVGSFKQALRESLRQDPDVLVIGDLIDPETTATALTAAETGHLVFATMHTQSAVRTVLRLLDQFDPSRRPQVRAMLASTLRAIVCQQLVPNADGRGRSLASEVMVTNAAISNLIREDRTWQIPMVMQTNKSLGMQMMDDSLRALVRSRTIAVEEAIARAADRETMMNDGGEWSDA